MKAYMLPLIGVLFVGPLAAADIDGRWRLTITGHNTYLFGESQLGAGGNVMNDLQHGPSFVRKGCGIGSNVFKYLYFA